MHFLSRLRGLAHRFPRLFAGLWFMVAAVPGPAIFFIKFPPSPRNLFTLMAIFAVLPLLCAFTAGARWGVRLYATRRFATTASAVFQGMWLIVLAYLIFCSVTLIIIGVSLASKGNLSGIFDGIGIFLFGFVFFGLPSMLGGGAGGALFHRLIACKSDIAEMRDSDVP